MNWQTFGKFILQPSNCVGCNQVSLNVGWRKSAKNAHLHGKTQFNNCNGLAEGWKTKTGRNEAATSPDPKRSEGVIRYV